MEVDPTRMCELLVGLPAVRVLGIIDEVGGPLWVHVETRGERPALRCLRRDGGGQGSAAGGPRRPAALAAPPDWCGASTLAQPTVAAAGTLDGTGVVRMTDATGHRATTAARPWM